MDILLIIAAGIVVLAGLILLGVLLFAFTISHVLSHDEHSEEKGNKNERL